MSDKGVTIERVIADEEAFVRTLKSDAFKYLMAAALHRATGIKGGVTSIDGLPHLIAEGVIAYLVASIEPAIEVRRKALATENTASEAHVSVSPHSSEGFRCTCEKCLT